MAISIAAVLGRGSFRVVGCFLYIRGSCELTPCEFDWPDLNEFDWLHRITGFDPLGHKFVTIVYCIILLKLVHCTCIMYIHL